MADASAPLSGSKPEPEGNLIPDTRIDGPDAEAEDVLAEPVSRDEADALGLAGAEEADAVAPAGRDDAIGIVVAAEKFLDAGHFEDALALAQEAVKEQPSLPKARLIMARAFMGLGEHAKALAILQAFSKTDETAESLHLRGIACAKLNRPAEALNFLQASLSMSGGDPRQQRRARELVARLKRKRGPESIASRDQAARPRPIERLKRRRRLGCLPKILLGLCVFALAAILLLFALRELAPGFFGFLRGHIANILAEAAAYIGGVL